jgi:HAD superfamily hydrolase (TIGR01509 family)
MTLQGRVILDRRDWDAAFFDMDGVLTDTARLHIDAWKCLFDGFLRSHAAVSGEAYVPFDMGTDYLTYVDGRLREDGVRLFLASRGINLPEGSEGDPDDAGTVAALSRRKDGMFLQALQVGADPLPMAEELLCELRRLGIGTAVVSSSRNCAAVLEAAGLSPHVRVDGLDSIKLRLPGKPAPDLFLEAARRLNVNPSRGTLFEDALAGVEAGRRGGFGQVVGVDLGDHAAALLSHGAHVVIRDLSEVAVASD